MRNDTEGSLTPQYAERQTDDLGISPLVDVWGYTFQTGSLHVCMWFNAAEHVWNLASESYAESYAHTVTHVISV